jgi:IS30 family transposase
VARFLTRAEQAEICRLYAAGLFQDEVARRVGRSQSVVSNVVRAAGGLPPDRVGRGERVLSLAEREEISRLLAGGASFRVIGGQLGRAPSTVSREVARNGGRTRYRAWAADRAADRRARRPKPAKLAVCPRLQGEVQDLLTQRWSPQQIARRLRVAWPDDPEMWVSHETIYQSLYVQGRGALRRELAACLRTGRAQRRSRVSDSRRSSRIKGMVMISERPAEVEDRAVPGHWEGDLIIGKDGKSAIATLVERSTRYVLLAKVNNQTASEVRQAIQRVIMHLPEQLRRSLTWDQGREMAEHAQFTLDTNIDVYFCDPHSPWQRGSNENTNGLLRQYFPKGTPLSGYSQTELDAVAIELNGRPRQTLDWATPAEKLNALLQ